MSRTWNKRTCDERLSPDEASLIGCALNVLKQSITCRWDGVKPMGRPSKQLLSGFVNSQAATRSIIQQNDISLKDLHPVIMYRCWGAGQGDENRCNLRETVPGFGCCLLGLSTEAGHSVTSTERVEGWQSKCIVLTKGTGNLMSWNVAQIGTSAKCYP